MMNVGVIGAGRIGQLHVKNLKKMDGISVKGVADIAVDHLQEWARQESVEYVTTDIKQIIDDPSIHAIFICSPTTTHPELIKQIAQAKKHIFCEKPISFAVDETIEALRVVEKEGVVLQVGFNRRFDRNFKSVRQEIETGVVGKTHTLRIISRDPHPPSISYIKTSGGLYMDMMIHDFDMARYVMQKEIVEVYAKGAVLVDEKIGDVGDVDTAIVLLTFEDGTLGVIENSRKAIYGYDQRLEVFGEKGALIVENDRPTNITRYLESGITSDKPPHFFLERYNDAYITEVEAFIAAIKGEEVVACRGFDGLQAERIAEAARKSAETGKPVQLSSEVIQV
nr:inositol 2-dehydrogenase [Lysinibacillus timonensis]